MRLTFDDHHVLADLRLHFELLLEPVDELVDRVDRRVHALETFDFGLDEARVGQLHLRIDERRGGEVARQRLIMIVGHVQASSCNDNARVIDTVEQRVS